MKKNPEINSFTDLDQINKKDNIKFSKSKETKIVSDKQLKINKIKSPLNKLKVDRVKTLKNTKNSSKSKSFNQSTNKSKSKSKSSNKNFKLIQNK